jgi:xanthine dehydrogenase accessory factor
MLTHDPKIDDPALKIVFNSPAFYIGALGSRKTQAARRQRLLADGISSDQLDRIHGPVGIDLGSDTPEEIALSVMAEIVAVSHGVHP